MLKISLRSSGRVANAKPKYPPDASGGYNNVGNVDNVEYNVERPIF